jgi:hypothetical protein
MTASKRASPERNIETVSGLIMKQGLISVAKDPTSLSN